MSRFRTQYRQGKTRMDTRTPSPEKAAGMRNIHRDTDGTVIGAIDRNGQALGSRARQGPADGSQIGNPVTTGLDRWRQMNPNAPTGQAAITAARGNSVRTAAAPAGSQLLSDRQQLHADMKKGVTPDMQARAKKLGVTDSSWRRVADKMPQSMAMMPGYKPQGGGGAQPGKPQPVQPQPDPQRYASL